MPYIDNEVKPELLERPLRTTGELNFVLTAVALSYLDERGLSYQTINDIQGAFVCASQEFSRRVVAPYEDTKIEENGDVYPCLTQS